MLDPIRSWRFSLLYLFVTVSFVHLPVLLCRCVSLLLVIGFCILLPCLNAPSIPFVFTVWALPLVPRFHHLPARSAVNFYTSPWYLLALFNSLALYPNSTLHLSWFNFFDIFFFEKSSSFLGIFSSPTIVPSVLYSMKYFSFCIFSPFSFFKWSHIILLLSLSPLISSFILYA